MKRITLLLLALLLASCAKQYLYRFPTETERNRYKPEELRWTYDGIAPDTIVVTDGEKLLRLPVTDQTKLEVRTTYGETYRFQLRSITVTGEGEFLGSNQMWRGYDLIAHVERTVQVREIANVVVISNDPATNPK